MKNFLLIGLILIMKQAIAQDTLSLSVEIDGKTLYLNLNISAGQTYINSKNNTNWIIDSFDDYVEIRTTNNQYLQFNEEGIAVIASYNQKAKWKLTDLGGLQYFIQPYGDKDLYLSLYGSEIRLLPYNPDLMKAIYQKWISNRW